MIRIIKNKINHLLKHFKKIIAYLGELKNIVFDLAGVVLNLDLERDTQALNGIGLPDFEGCVKDKAIAQPMIAYLDGMMDEKTFCDALRPLCRNGVTDEEMLYAMDAVLDIVPRERIELILSLRKKYRVFLLSNIYEKAWLHAVGEIEKHGLTVDDCFERVFLSYEMGMAKPDTRIFLDLIEKTGIVPEETLYFDDSRSNVEAGTKVGFISHLVPINGLDEMLKNL